jgi:hypothetical protein
VTLPGQILDLTVGYGVWATFTSCPIYDRATVPCSVGVEASWDHGRTWHAVATAQGSYQVAQMAIGSDTVFLAEWRDATGWVPGSCSLAGVEARVGAHPRSRVRRTIALGAIFRSTPPQTAYGWSVAAKARAAPVV